MLSLLSFLILGLVFGAIARFLVPGRQPMGLLATTALGCVGSLVGGTLGSLIFAGSLDITPAGWFGSIVGAILVLIVGMRLGGGRRV